ncbi:MAG: hypothetical protein KTR31_15990 [Myxococcales bacterium]|nr:hypothetical protein [Myxococcales bacterium]
MRLVLPALIVGGSLAGLAHAQAWTDFAPAFPPFPCHDGWMACVVDGARVTPDLSGSPADFRVDWFELTPTPSFSPFVSLSNYDAFEGNAAAEAAALAEADRLAEQRKREAIAAAEAQQEAERAAEEANLAMVAAQEEEQRRRQEAQELERQRQDLERQRQQAQDQAERDRLAREEEQRRQAAAKADQEAQDAARRADAQRQAEEDARRQAALEDERRRQAEAERRAAEEAQERARQAQLAAEAAAAVTVPKPTTLAPADDSCDELTRLEPDAMLGRLTSGQIACLEGRVASDTKMTDKEKASLVLMANSWSSGDRKTWEGLVKRHLDQIDQSDPNLCYKYALYLSNAGSSRAANVIRWVEVALDNRSVWTGDTYTSRVNSLYRLRAKASQDLWKKAEERHAAGPSDETRATVEKDRNMTKVYAREWYEYALRAGKDTTLALQLCMSAAGTKDYCEAS